MHADQLFNSTTVSWMEAEKGPVSDIVVSSRIRLARNLSRFPFPHLLNSEKGRECLEQIKEAWGKSGNGELGSLELITLDQLNPLQRQILVEKHLISPLHAASSDDYRGVLVNSDGSLAIMINEEDHIRIQCLLPGLQVGECYGKAQAIDDELEKNLNFAFDETRGYLTSCPTNVGTGMRASVMLHLPAVAISGLANRIFQNISQFGMTVRGLYGEGSEVIGNFFQLSNQVTLGQSEEDIVAHLTSVATQIVEQERVMRTRLESEMKYQLEDRVGRAFGILTNARIITSSEAIALLSDLRLGVDIGMISGIKTSALNELVVAMSPAHLQQKAGQEMDGYNRDLVRAQVIQETLRGEDDTGELTPDEQ